MAVVSDRIIAAHSGGRRIARHGLESAAAGWVSQTAQIAFFWRLDAPGSSRMCRSRSSARPEGPLEIGSAKVDAEGACRASGLRAAPACRS